MTEEKPIRLASWVSAIALTVIAAAAMFFVWAFCALAIGFHNA